MVRLRFLYLLAIAFALASAAPTWQTFLFAQPRSGTVLAAHSAAFAAPAGLPDPNAIYRQVNQARVAAGLQPLVRNDVLARLATERAQDMSQNNYYAHANKAGKYFYDVLGTEGYEVEYGCENLDLDFTTEPTVYTRAWLNSTAGHRECMLNQQVTDAGYAVATIAAQGDNELPSYVVVAIHATEPTSKK